MLASIKSATVICIIVLLSSIARGDDDLPVQLAKIYHADIDVSAFLVSEKYDGIRAIWKDGVLRTRTGEPIHAPDWFVAPLPDIWLDGELWTERRDFERLSSIVRKQTPVDREWRCITYMVFDAPDLTRGFGARAGHYTRLLTNLGIPHVKPTPQYRVSNRKQLLSLLSAYTDAGAEGLMLHRADAVYHDGRSDHLLKLKTYLDDEAVVIGHRPGKGKYTGKMGALEVRWKRDGEAVVFRIGTGFSDADRADPPPLGSTITFKYHGLTRNGIPKFASFLRQRESSRASQK